MRKEGREKTDERVTMTEISSSTRPLTNSESLPPSHLVSPPGLGAGGLAARSRAGRCGGGAQSAEIERFEGAGGRRWSRGMKREQMEMK